ncbi:uncharacterized protein LOC124272139 [Haliotis rubra]|uniref:uncharacterized protein LOC124272139 n=1 Tax=Haliotis rubra TaxID=36100 RepID=UPI001EE600B9|nr:uncharacterized protein LOC124272139 [Haliotis rubra]
MDVKYILIIAGLCLCFHLLHGKVQFEALFNFGLTSFEGVSDTKAERFEKLEKNVSLHRCKYACVDRASCQGAIFSEINSDGCFPTNCTNFYSRGLYGECHLLTLDDAADVIDFASELEGKRRNYFLNLPTLCRPIPQTREELMFTSPEVYNVTLDKADNNCYIFKYRCRPGYTAVGNPEARCCNNGIRSPITLECHEDK